MKFHCDWVVHRKLDRNATAQEMLRQFDAANIQLKVKLKLENLPEYVRQEILQISGMKLFKKELFEFLDSNSLPKFGDKQNSWTEFLMLYAKVIEDCPLEIIANTNNSSIDKVQVSVELAKDPHESEMFFKVNWTIFDKNGETGKIYVLNSFSIQPP